MDHVVAKDFKTANRRFKVGDAVAESDVVGRVTFDVWKDRGFIKVKDEVKIKPTAPAPAPVLKTWAAPKNTTARRDD